ncbi:MAG: hypothetical protein ACI4RC_06335 [Oscillospiraceae bacterium]
MTENKTNVIIKFDCKSEQTVGDIKKIVGLVSARYIIPIIDSLNLEANPRSAKVGVVTNAIQDSIRNDPLVFPFKTKGILLASSNYENLERNRIRIMPDDKVLEGILDGGHNTLAIGLYILNEAMLCAGLTYKAPKNWDEFKQLWFENHNVIDDYVQLVNNDPDDHSLDFYVPVELLVPENIEDSAVVDSFQKQLLEICAARNNNVQLPLNAKVNQHGYFDKLKEIMIKNCPDIANKVSWKPNDGGSIKIENIIALSWIPLALIDPVNDNNGRSIDSISPNTIYSGKGSCMKQFERLMSSPDVSRDLSDNGYKKELINSEVESAFEITSKLPELYDYIFEKLPELYNKICGGKYGRITSVKTLNKKKHKFTPFYQKKVDMLSPEGFIIPLVYGLQALMERRYVDGKYKIVWKEDPKLFLENNLSKIVQNYYGIFALCNYDPQKVGKNAPSYNTSLNSYKMAVAGIL